MATGSQAGPVQCLSWEDKPAASQTDLPSWVSEWRDCSLGTITRGEANLLGKFLSGLHRKRKGEEEDEGGNYSLVIFFQGWEEFFVCLRIKSGQQWLFFILLLAALCASVPVSWAGSST